MSIDIHSEKLVRLNHVGRHLPGKINAATVWRWTAKGIRGGIRLESCFVGGAKFTSLQAIERFVARVTAAAEGKQGERQPSHTAKERGRSIAQAERSVRRAAEGKPRPSYTAKQRQRSIAQAERRLKQAGI